MTSQQAYGPPMEDTTPIPVHVTGVAADVSLGQLPKAPARKYRSTVQTIVLTGADPVQNLLPQADDRVIAWVQALDFDIVLGKDKGVVGAASNTAQTPATPNLPSGLLIPAANGAPYPVQENGVVYVGATNTGANSRVTVSAVYRA